MHSNKSHCQPYYPFPSCSYKMHFGYGSDFVNILCFERFGFFLVCCLHFVALRQRSINLFPFIQNPYCEHTLCVVVSLSIALHNFLELSSFIRSNDFQNFSFDTSCLILVCVVNSFFFFFFFVYFLDASEMQTPRIRRIAYFISKTQ